MPDYCFLFKVNQGGLDLPAVFQVRDKMLSHLLQCMLNALDCKPKAGFVPECLLVRRGPEVTSFHSEKLLILELRRLRPHMMAETTAEGLVSEALAARPGRWARR